MTASNCGCWEGIGPLTPADVFNPPGLPSLAYRIGTYGTFRASLLAALSGHPALLPLRSRSSEDFTIALLDAFAVMGDVLTFYSERIVNEAFLRTATEQLSVNDLVALIGYIRKPGTAATTALAFTLENAPGSPVATILKAGIQVQSLPAQDMPSATFETVEDVAVDPAYNAIGLLTTMEQRITTGMSNLVLDGVDANVRRGDALLLVDASANAALRIVADVQADRAAKTTTLVLDSAVNATSGDAPLPGVYVFRTRASLFGARAPLQPGSPPSEWTPAQFQLTDDGLFLDAAYDKVSAAGYVALYDPSDGVGPDAVTVRSFDAHTPSAVIQYGMSDYGSGAKVTAILFASLKTVKGATGSARPMAFLRNRTVYAQSDSLVLAPLPIAEQTARGLAITTEATAPEISLGRKVAVEGLPPGGGAKLGEIVTVAAVLANSDGTQTLTFAAPLQNVYDVNTVALNLNVAKATHGESKHEVLGSGDATVPFRSLTLQQAPLTYVQAPTAGGNASTLTVRVNDVAWHETDVLYGARPHDRVFLTRLDDAGKTVVTFGDGSLGEIPPTGTQNVVADYRMGGGGAGNLPPNRITLPLTRPLGMRSVTNPVAASGGEDPERIDDVRLNGPIHVKTLDRVVSLTDYQDFARTFSGIAKALATWTWDGERRSIFLTVAGVGGASLDAAGPTMTGLLAAIQTASEPDVNLRVATYRPASFELGVSIAIDPDHDVRSVTDAVRAALSVRFSFAAMQLGEAVSESEVVAAVQAVDGVVASRLDVLRRQPTDLYFERFPWLLDAPLSRVLFASAPQAGERGNLLAAELLIAGDVTIGTFA